MTSTLPSSDWELEEVMRGIMAAKIRKAGLHAEYAVADCETGRRLYKLAKEGRGAYLHGPCGTGKTYAAACAVRLAVEDMTSAKLVSVARLLDDIRRDYGERDGFAMWAAENVRLLVLDDLGAERPTEWAVERLCELVDYRTMRGKPTIVTSNYSLGEMRNRFGDVQGMRLASRIGGACEILEMGGPDRRLGNVRP